MNFIKIIKNSFIALLFAIFASSASAFDANNHDASMLSESELKSMVSTKFTWFMFPGFILYGATIGSLISIKRSSTFAGNTHLLDKYKI